MIAIATILVVDEADETRFLLLAKLQQQFPRALIHTCRFAETAVIASKASTLGLIICHRTFTQDAVALVGLLRAQNGAVPILAMADIGRFEAAKAAGATACICLADLPNLGAIVEEIETRSARQFSERSSAIAN